MGPRQTQSVPETFGATVTGGKNYITGVSFVTQFEDCSLQLCPREKPVRV